MSERLKEVGCGWGGSVGQMPGRQLTVSLLGWSQQWPPSFCLHPLAGTELQPEVLTTDTIDHTTSS